MYFFSMEKEHEYNISNIYFSQSLVNENYEANCDDQYKQQFYEAADNKKGPLYNSIIFEKEKLCKEDDVKLKIEIKEIQCQSEQLKQNIKLKIFKNWLYMEYCSDKYKNIRNSQDLQLFMQQKESTKTDEEEFLKLLKNKLNTLKKDIDNFFPQKNLEIHFSFLEFINQFTFSYKEQSVTTKYPILNSTSIRLDIISNNKIKTKEYLFKNKNNLRYFICRIGDNNLVIILKGIRAQKAKFYSLVFVINWEKTYLYLKYKQNGKIDILMIPITGINVKNIPLADLPEITLVTLCEYIMDEKNGINKYC